MATMAKQTQTTNPMDYRSSLPIRLIKNKTTHKNIEENPMPEFHSQLENIMPAQELRLVGKHKGINRDVISSLYNKGLNDVEIASRLQCNKSNIWYWRKKLRLKANTNRGAQTGGKNPVFKAIINGNWQDPAKRRDIRLKLSDMRLRNGNPQFKGSSNRYHYRNRLKLLGYDLSTCSMCGSKRNVVIHHKDGNPTNDDPANILIVCMKCHAQFHKWGKNGFKKGNQFWKLKR